MPADPRVHVRIVGTCEKIHHVSANRYVPCNGKVIEHIHDRITVKVCTVCDQ